MKKSKKTAMITARVQQEVKEFYDNYRGLTSKVLEDFYFQYKEMQTKKIKKSSNFDRKDE